jgi:hypothetical protein
LGLLRQPALDDWLRIMRQAAQRASRAASAAEPPDQERKPDDEENAEPGNLEGKSVAAERDFKRALPQNGPYTVHKRASGDSRRFP